MEHLERELKNLFKIAVNQAFGTDVSIPEFSVPPGNIDAEFTLPCFPFARKLRSAPPLIAGKILAHFPSNDLVEKVTATGPYLNIKLNPERLIHAVLSKILARGDKTGWTQQENPQTILVEYSSPNTNKPLHLGHVRNNVLGMAMINILRAMGHRVIPASIMNDRGIHICKAMVAYRRFGEGSTPESTGIKGDHFAGKMYIRFDQAGKEDPTLMDEARSMLQAWEAGDRKVRDLWSLMNGWVYDGFRETYNRLGSGFDLVQYESETYKLGKDIVQEGLDKNVFTTREDGSVGVDLTDSGLDDKTLFRADGTSLYIIQDLGVAVERFRDHALDRVIYIVASEQNYHFQVLFEIFKRMGFDWAEDCHHLNYGMVYLPEGKMKSREGKVVDADDLMDEMKKLVLEIMESSHFNVAPANRDEIAEAIGVGAIKYYILKVGTQKDIHFDPQQSVSFEGATGAYLQYTHARIKSLILKSGTLGDSEAGLNSLGNPEELDVVRQLMRYPGVIAQAARDLNPSRIATYLWELAKSFNVFYTKCPVLKADVRELAGARIALSRAVGHTLNSGLGLLGIKAVNQM